MTLVITATTPDGTLTENIYPKRMEIQAQLNEPSSLRMEFEGYWDRYNDETDSDNPLQLNSLITVTRNGTVIHNSIVITRTLIEEDNGKKIIVECGDRLYAMSRYPTGNGTYYDYKLPSPSVASGTIDMYPIKDAATYNKYGYPDPDESDHWMPTSIGTYQTVYTSLNGNIDDSVTTIQASTTHYRMRTVGLIKIDSEIIYYEGYDLDNSTPQRYIFKNCVRGCLGTSEAAHLNGVNIYQMVAKRIDPYEDSYTCTATAASGDVSVYYPRYADGALYFPDGALAATGHTMQYTYIDENDATSDADFQTFESTIADIIPWSSSYYDINVPLIVLPFMSYDGRSRLSTLESLITEMAGQSVIYNFSITKHPGIYYWHDQSDDKVYVSMIFQSSSPTILNNAYKVTTRFSLADVYSTWAASSSRSYVTTSPAIGDYPLVELTGIYQPTANSVLYRPDEYTKLYGNWATKFGGTSESGLSTDNGARALAAYKLIDSLDTPTAKTFEFRELPYTLPALASTYQVGDYDGICIRLSYKAEGNYEYMALDLVDYGGGGGIV